MNRAERFMKNHLDHRERELMAKWKVWLEGVFMHIQPGLTEQQIHKWHLWHAGTLSSTLFRHVHEMLDDGRAHGEAEAKSLQRHYGVKLADYDLPGIDVNENFTPEKAIATLKQRAIVLAGDVESAIVEQVKKILLAHLAGTSPQATMESLADLREFNMNRAALVTITETCYAYNRGRLISYRENNVDYVRFSAIMDARTSQICQSRNGLVMAMNDPELASNTPPLHGRCRSVLTPIYSKYEPDLITDQNTDWGNVEPVPKSWKTGK